MDDRERNAVPPRFGLPRTPGATWPETALVFDDRVTGTADVFTSSDLHCVLGARERAAIQVVADGVTGTAPTLTVQVEHSADGRTWGAKNTVAEVDGALAVGSVTSLVGFDSGSRPAHPLARLSIRLGGTAPDAHVRVWVTLRDLT